MDMIRTALLSNDDYYKRHVVGEVDHTGCRPRTCPDGDYPVMNGTTLPAIPEATKPGSAGEVTVDRWAAVCVRRRR